jgi:hypothetical protein
VAVEKLICGKRSQITSRQDALETIFSGRLDIGYPQHAVFVDIDFFNTHGLYRFQRTPLSSK